MPFRHFPFITFLFLLIIVCTIDFISIQKFHKIATFCALNVLLPPFSLPLQLFSTIRFHCNLCPAPALRFFHLLFDSSPLPFNASGSLHFPPNFPRCYPFATQRRAQSHGSCSSASLFLSTNVCIRVESDISYGSLSHDTVRRTIGRLSRAAI